ncbi:MAG TPA: transaldolase family protein [Solirubrobacterales bacterium]|nr:transaldolase family protein [Solirubrobacterales bacterium]
MSSEGSLTATPADRPYLAHLGDRLAAVEPGRAVAVTPYLREVVDEFRPPDDEVPAGFRVELSERGGEAVFDLVRDISRGRDGSPRPTPLIFSVDSANPYEIAPFADFVGNLTCNPGIVYDLFLNDPAANVDDAFGSLEEVLEEIGRILGPGADISVELHNPFEPDFAKVLEEVQRYEAIVSKHRLVVKVPHTGPVNADNVGQLLDGDGRLDRRYDQGRTGDYLRGHNLALRLHEAGYRVNFTLMFEPHQIALALQARPYFINAFVRHRHKATQTFRGLLAAYETSEDRAFVEQLRSTMIAGDYLSGADSDADLLHVLEKARAFLHDRLPEDGSADGLDGAREALRWLQTVNLPDTRLIVCSMDGPLNYPDLMAMLTEPEFIGMHDKVVVTAEPAYLARWTSSPHVVAYQRRFMRAARHVNEPPP